MTANQINYVKYLEDVRTHKATEEISREQARAATSQAESAASQAQSAAMNAETNRMNASTNVLNAETNQSAVGAQWYGAQANAAYQQAMAAVSQAQQSEAVRHNKTTEANDLIKSGRETTAKNYATQKNYELGMAQIQSNERNVDVQSRAGLVREGMSDVTDLTRSLLSIDRVLTKGSR